MNLLKKLARIPVLLAVAGAFLNSADLLREFQPDGRAWVGYVAALSLSVALFTCIEAFLHRPSTVTALAVIGFGAAEVATQVLHAGLVREDVVIITDTLRWFMAYLAPSLVVLVGVSMPFIVQWGFGENQPQESTDVTALRADVASLADLVRQQALLTSAAASVKRSANGHGKSVQLALLDADGAR